MHDVCFVVVIHVRMFFKLKLPFLEIPVPKGCGIYSGNHCKLRQEPNLCVCVCVAKQSKRNNKKPNKSFISIIGAAFETRKHLVSEANRKARIF